MLRKLKLVTAALLVLMAMGMFILPAAAETAEISILPSVTGDIEFGKTITFPIHVDNANEVSAYQFKITADPLKLVVVNPANQTVPTGFLPFISIGGDGASITIGTLSTGATFSGSNTLAYAEYQISNSDVLDGSTATIGITDVQWEGEYSATGYSFKLPDHVAPEITISAAPTTVGKSFNIIGNATDVGGFSDPANIQVLVDGAALPADSIEIDASNPSDVGFKAAVVDATGGTHTIKVIATDGAENIATKEITVNVDADAPEITDIKPDTEYTGNEVMFSANIGDAKTYTVKLDGTDVTDQVSPLVGTLDGTTTIAGTFTLEDNEHTFEVSAADEFGNTAVEQVRFISQTPNSVDITPKDAPVSPNGFIQYSAVVKDKRDIDLHTQPTLVWSIDNESVANIDSTGKLTAVDYGTANVTATVSGTEIKGTTPVRVVPLYPCEINIENSPYEVTSTQNVTLVVNVKDQYGDPMENVAFNWTVSDPSLGYFIDNVVFNASRTLLGNTITVTAVPIGNDTISATATIVIKPLVPTDVVVAVAVPETPGTLEVGDECDILYTVIDQFNNYIPEMEATLRSSNTTVATVNTTTENVTAVGPGTVEIIATAGAASNKTTLTVVSQIPREMELDSYAATINATESVTFTATVYDKRAAVIADAPVTWTVSPETAGRIVNGIFTAAREATGDVTITAYPTGYQELNKTATVTVIPLHVVSVEISKDKAEDLEVLDTTQFAATIKDQLGNEFTPASLTWAVNNSTVGTIDENGLFTANEIGVVEVNATADGVTSESVIINVVAAVPRSITIEPVEATLNYTEVVYLNVTIKDKNGNVLDIKPVWAGVDGFGDINETNYFNASVRFIEENKVIEIQATPETGNPDLHANATITVNGFFATTINFIGEKEEIEPEDHYQFEAEVLDQFGNIFLEGRENLRWNSSNPIVGTINNETGYFEALKAGETLIFAESGNAIKVTFVKVYKEFVPEKVIDITEEDDGAKKIIVSGETELDVNVDEKFATITNDSAPTMIVYFDAIYFNDTNTINGTISNVDVIYEPMEVSAPLLNGVTFVMNLSLNDIVENLPKVTPAFNYTIGSAITAYNDKYNVSAMVEVDSNVNDNLTSVELIFTIPKEITYDKSKIKVLHVVDDGVSPVPDSLIKVDDAGTNWKITVTGELTFSAYAVAVDTYVPYIPPSSGGGGSSGSSTWATVTPTPTPTATPTATPTDTQPTDTAPTVQPTSGQPTKPAGTPVPIAGLILGGLAAAAILRRK